MEILNYFKEREYDIVILSTGTVEDRLKLTNQGFQAIDVGSVVMNPLKAFRFLFRLFRNLKSIRPLIIFSFTIRPNIFGSIIARVLSIPIVSNVTGTGPLITDKSLLYQLIRMMYRFAFTKNRRIFFQNSDDFDYFISKKFVRTDQAILLPGSGVDTEYYQPIPKSSKSPFRFLMISRLIRDKGVMEYIQAAGIVKSKHPELEFQVLGPYWTQSISKNTILSSEIEEFVSKNWIQYLGHTLDIRPFVAEADCIVLPSYREGCANVLMQGASMGKPLIASDVTGCKNLIDDGETGLICKVKNAEDLAEKMIEMISISDEIRQKMGEKGRQKMISEYPKSKVLEAYAMEISQIQN